MRIDPEVAALLNDLPPITLPPVLVAEGWGQHSSRDALVGTQRKPTEGSQQPTYTDHCVQCGRPITLNRRRMWTDHAGRRECENVLLDKSASYYHVTQAEVDFDAAMRDGIRVAQEYPLSKPKSKPNAKCSATKHRASHVHTCPHPEGHFGFHECIECRHLWR